MRDILQKVVEHGTGWRTAMEGYTIGGKTGTAEKLSWENGKLKRADGKFILSFIGFAPVEDPEVVIYCVVDEPDVPQQDMSGAGTTLFHMISSELFPYLNIYRTNDLDPSEIDQVDDPVETIIADGPVEDVEDVDSEDDGSDEETYDEDRDDSDDEDSDDEESDSGGDQGSDDEEDDPGGDEGSDDPRDEDPGGDEESDEDSENDE